ncbi:hypothetical protein HOY80DRAFT_1138502 [Tuber brumale]|nr:hypothetical protein HOY80DRAFT_1138502 [Tuber brumale]
MNSYVRNMFSNNNSSFNVTTHNYTTVSDEESRVLSWISPLESWKRRSSVAHTRAKGVGEWALQSSEFQAWRQGGRDQSGGRILFGRGAPGARKTLFDQTPEVMIGSLLRQFVTPLPEVPEAIKQVFREAMTHVTGWAPELTKLIELFLLVLERFHQVLILVGALDGFVAEYRVGFLRSLHLILDKSPNTKFDIERYLATKLDTDPHHGAMNYNLRSEIFAKVLKESSEIFLLFTLQVDSILGDVTIGGRRKKLHETTNDLDNSYTAIIQRIRGQYSTPETLGISALMWISLAERPLLVDELCHALAVEARSPNIK